MLGWINQHGTPLSYGDHVNGQPINLQGIPKIPWFPATEGRTRSYRIGLHNHGTSSLRHLQLSSQNEGTTVLSFRWHFWQSWQDHLILSCFRPNAKQYFSVLEIVKSAATGLSSEIVVQQYDPGFASGWLPQIATWIEDRLTCLGGGKVRQKGGV